MEAVAWMAGLTHTDCPACTCPVICGFVQAVNDRMDERERQSLTACVPQLIGTADPGLTVPRARLLIERAFALFLQPASIVAANSACAQIPRARVVCWRARSALARQRLDAASRAACAEMDRRGLRLLGGEAELPVHYWARIEQTRAAVVLAGEMERRIDVNSCTSAASVVIAAGGQIDAGSWCYARRTLTALLNVREDGECPAPLAVA